MLTKHQKDKAVYLIKANLNQPMMRNVVRLSFTLLELLIVMFILSLGATLTGIKIKELYQEQRFLSEAQQVLSFFKLAQDLMLIMDTDVKVHLDKESEKDQINLSLEIEKPLEKPWSGLIERELHLKSIKFYEFKENESARKSESTLLFTMGKMSKGVLILFEGEKDSDRSLQRQYAIEFMGYPSPITGNFKAVGAEDDDFPKKERRLKELAMKSKALYPNEVYEKISKKPKSP